MLHDDDDDNDENDDDDDDDNADSDDNDNNDNTDNDDDNDNDDDRRIIAEGTDPAFYPQTDGLIVPRCSSHDNNDDDDYEDKGDDDDDDDDDGGPHVLSDGEGIRFVILSMAGSQDEPFLVHFGFILSLKYDFLKKSIMKTQR